MSKVQEIVQNFEDANECISVTFLPVVGMREDTCTRKA